MTEELDPAQEARVFAIDRPAAALMRVYLVRAFGAALGFLALGGLVALRFHDLVFQGVGALATKGMLPVAVGGLYFVCYLAAVLAFYVRWKTLHYRFDRDGVAQKWGLFFRRESFLAYARIQDVKVSQGLIERHFGLGTVRIQTAGADKGAEEVIEGLPEHELVGHFLKARTRGAKSGAKRVAPVAKLAPERDPIHVLGEIEGELRLLRGALAGHHPRKA